jgi:Fe2+ or Zn2+ uptake regulation protein
MTHHLLNIPQRMHSGGYRLTPQRKAILDAICEAGRRVTVDEILRRVHRKSPSLNPATVYRNLNFLQEMHLVHATGTGKRRRFEIAAPEPRHLLICRICGEEIELERKLVSRLAGAIRRQFQFRLDDDRLVFSGLCGSCFSRGSGSRKHRTVSRRPKTD